MREIRYLDKLIDELAKGRPMEKILRTQERGDRSPEASSPYDERMSSRLPLALPPLALQN